MNNSRARRENAVRARKGTVVIQEKKRLGLQGAAEACTGVILYEGIPGLESAIAMCQQLTQRFSGDLKFEFTWWGFKYLNEPAMAAVAAQEAVEADLVVLSLQGSDTLPASIQNWFGQWIGQRTKPEGALVVVRRPSLGQDWATLESAYFKALAQRANLDYLPISLPGREPRLMDRLRDDDVFPNLAGLRQVPDHQFHSTGWGINE